VGEVSEAEAEAEVGRISLVQTRQDLNSMDVDLTAQLLRGTAKDPAGAGNEKGRQSAPKIPTIQVVKRQQAQGDTTAQRKTQRETRAWSRSVRYGSKPIAAPNNTPEQAEQELEDQLAYDKLKTELYLWTIGLTAVCMGAAVTFYSRDVAASYGVGALAGFLYLRSLSRQVDSFGSGFGGAGSPRLLIPLVLAAGFNRYNTLIAEDTGLYLSLLPMLVGFFTYKVALVGKQGLDLADDIFEREREQS
jgi:ATP synthase protein I